MRQRLLYFAYAGFNAILIAAALAFALYVSDGKWIIKGSGEGLHKHQKGGGPGKQLRQQHR